MSMMIPAKITLFILGMCAAIQVIAAFYHLLDLWYTIKTAYLKVLRRIVMWIGISAAMVFLLGEEWRGAFVWGMALYAPFCLINVMLLHAIIRYRCRLHSSGKFGN